MSLISLKIIFQCVSWRDKLASSAKNRLNAETIGAALAWRGASQPMWTTQRFNKGVAGRRLASLGATWRGVNRALQMRSLALSTVGEFKKERTRLRPKSDFFLAWEIGCVAWERVKTCKSVCHTSETVESWQLCLCLRGFSVAYSSFLPQSKDIEIGLG